MKVQKWRNPTNVHSRLSSCYFNSKRTNAINFIKDLCPELNEFITEKFLETHLQLQQLQRKYKQRKLRKLFKMECLNEAPSLTRCQYLSQV